MLSDVLQGLNTNVKKTTRLRQKVVKEGKKSTKKPQKDTKAVRFKADPRQRSAGWAQTPKGTLDGKDFNFDGLRIACLVKAL